MNIKKNKVGQPPKGKNPVQKHVNMYESDVNILKKLIAKTKEGFSELVRRLIKEEHKRVTLKKK